MSRVTPAQVVREIELATKGLYIRRQLIPRSRALAQSTIDTIERSRVLVFRRRRKKKED